MKKVSILGLHLGIGGVEQAICNLANILADDFMVEIAVAYKIMEKPTFFIDSRVKIQYLTELKPVKEEWKQAIKQKNIKNIIKYSFQNIRVLQIRKTCMKKYIRQTDANIIVSSRILYTGLLGKYAKKGVITIAQEHRHHNNDVKYISSLKKSIKNIDYLMPVSQELTDFYQQNIANEKTKFVFIPHALSSFPSKPSTLEEKRIISVGRLSPEKGFLEAIEVFKDIYQTHPDWHFDIAGDGVQKKEIEQKVKEYHLENAITIHGWLKKTEVEALYQKSSLYMMCSFEESFGLVLIEANSYGIPCLSYDSAQGASEIIENKKTGYLIQNRNRFRMVKEFDKLISDISLRKKMGKQARRQAEIYKIENIQKRWLAFLNTIIK